MNRNTTYKTLPYQDFAAPTAAGVTVFIEQVIVGVEEVEVSDVVAFHRAVSYTVQYAEDVGDSDGKVLL